MKTAIVNRFDILLDKVRSASAEDCRAYLTQMLEWAEEIDDMSFVESLEDAIDVNPSEE